MADEQTIFPLTDYLKHEILTIRTNVGNYLKRYRLEDGESTFSKMRKQFYQRQFITELILLYTKVRPSILRSKPKKDGKDMFVELRITRWELLEPDFNNIKDWIKKFVLLDAFLDKIGITRLEVDREDFDQGLRRV